MDLIGRTIGKYQIVSPLGQGAMGLVYTGYRADLDHYAAVKILPAHLASSPDFQQRFKREAHAIAQLDHPHILPMIDFGQEADGLTYFVTKLAKRGSLADRLGRPLPLSEVGDFLTQIAAALDHAHQRQMIHRDVKPANVLLDDNDWVLLGDFGMVKLLSDPTQSLGESLVGTPAYMSPEQCLSQPLDRRTDIYALGITVFEMLTGRVPFALGQPGAILLQQVNEEPPSVRSIRPDVSAATAQVVAQSLAKRPTDRYATAGDFALAFKHSIEPAAPSEPVSPHAITTVSGGVNVDAEQVEVGGDLVGRDKIVQVHNYYGGTADTPQADPLADLPPPPTIDSRLTQDFVGREAELAYHLAKLTTQHLAVITGMPGIGKTTLALQVARRFTGANDTFAHTFREGEGADVLVWELAKFLAWHQQPALWSTLHGVSRTGSQPPPLEVLFDSVLHLIRGHNYVLLLDNFHTVETDPVMIKLLDRLRDLLATGEISLIIATQRLPAFALSSDYVALSGLDRAAALNLLNRRGIQLQPPVAERLWQITEGNPQLLTLTISALHGVEDVAQFIERVAEAADIERYLMTAIDRHLTAEERTVMSAVAIFLGQPATRDALEVVLEDDRTIHSSLKLLLSGLRDRFLLLENGLKNGQAYSQHETVRSFYYNLLNRRERLALHRRAGEYYATEEPDALRAARQFDHAHDYPRAVQLATADAWGAINRGQAHSLRNLLDQLGGHTLPPIDLAAVQVTHGQLSVFLGESHHAQERYQQALPQLEALPVDRATRSWQARACLGLGDALQYEDPQQAVDWLQRGLELVNGADIPEEAMLRIQLGSVQLGMSNYAEALAETEHGLRLLPKTAAHWHAVALMDLGIIHWKRGDAQRGTAYYRQALDIYQRTQDFWGIMPVRLDLGIEFDRAGHWPQAVAEYQAALDLANQLQAVRSQTVLELAFGIISTKQGHDEQARAHLARCLELARRHKLKEFIVAGLSSLSDLHIRLNEWGAAEQAIAEAEPLAVEMDAKDQLPELQRGRALIALARGQFDLAHPISAATIELCRDLELKVDQGLGWRILGQVFTAEGQAAPADDAFARSMELVRDDGYEVARTQAEWGRALLCRASEIERGCALLGEARSTFERLGAQRDIAALELTQTN